MHDKPLPLDTPHNLAKLHEEVAAYLAFYEDAAPFGHVPEWNGEPVPGPYYAPQSSIVDRVNFYVEGYEEDAAWNRLWREAYGDLRPDDDEEDDDPWF